MYGMWSDKDGHEILKKRAFLTSLECPDLQNKNVIIRVVLSISLCFKDVRKNVTT